MLLLLLGSLIFCSNRSHHVGMGFFQLTLQTIKFCSLTSRCLCHSFFFFFDVLIKSLLLLLIDELPLAQLLLVTVKSRMKKITFAPSNDNAWT
jgi:hypothetical protein